MQFLPALMAVTLAAPAFAAVDDQVIAARDAWRRNDIATLNSIAATITPGQTLSAYPAYWAALKAVDSDDDVQPQAFLNSQPDSVMTERVRNEWLKKLGKREDWVTFSREWPKLAPEGSDEESRCYNDLYALRQGRSTANYDAFLASRQIPDGCTTLIVAAANKGVLSQDWVLRRVRLLLAANYLTAARQLAAMTLLPVDLTQLSRSYTDLSTSGGQEAVLYDIVSRARGGNIDGAASQLLSVQNQLSKERTAFAWGQLALFSAKKLEMGQALQWFDRADPNQLTDEQWEWWGRAALRTQQWPTLDRVIAQMPDRLSSSNTWQYWKARSLKAQGRENEARPLFAKVSNSGRNFYALLSLDELGTSMASDSRTEKASGKEVAAVAAEPAVQRSLALFNLSENYRKPELREDARREWRWAMRGKSDQQLLAAAELAKQQSFLDMAIYSADRTVNVHDYSLRYLTPYRDITHRYANLIGVDEAWVYGLIRQESRFVSVARSGVGASGLMQLMPSTAKWVAGKIGLGSYAVNNIDTNIQMGTWYLSYVLDKLGQEVLATAAYNAGPSRAKAWQADVPMEGAVYAETIPFTETREYVQKVMTNAAYYASGFGEGPQSLKRRIGIIPAK
ncbi:transglycosylase SLT domain-containing protein [Crenobacter sp. SG2305]|uniref:lytic transglycosylase domain-containing protein n=1 Tax=Crenobacter oryzisoli TaxID=3056844 RepID=UPI0025AA99B5|nr:lytic transglycosylase domain-containing protein [Crenobacter sp. SG2305]MDN0081945.1 transglycosylase SLT domain-containing protein [Crenobacter sp. SG2305]